MGDTNSFMVAQAKAAQVDRLAGISWDYLNVYDPQYPELLVYRKTRHPMGQMLSVEEARKKLTSKQSAQSTRRSNG